MKVCQYCSHRCEDSASICPSCGANQFYSDFELQKREDRLRAEEEKWKIAEDAQKQRARKLLGTLFAIVIVVVAAISIISYIRASKPYRDAGVSRSETKEYLEAGINLFDNGNYAQAIEYLLKIPSGTTQYEEAQAKLQDSIIEYKNYVKNTTNSYIQKGNHEAAFDLIESAYALLPNDDDLKSMYEEIYSAYLTTVRNKASDYAEEGNYEVGLNYLSKIIERFPNDISLQSLYKDVQYEYQTTESTTAIGRAEQLSGEGNLADAIKVIEGAIAKIGQTDELSARLSQLEKAYCDDIISRADHAYKESGYARAVEIIDEGLRVLSSNSTLLQERARYESLRPILLTEITPSRENGFPLSVIPNFASLPDRSYDIAMNTGGTPNWKNGNTYHIEKAYSSFHCYFVLGQDYLSLSPYQPEISIYDEHDHQLYYAKLSYPDVEEIEVSIDISGVRDLRICMGNCIYNDFGTVYYLGAMLDPAFVP